MSGWLGRRWYDLVFWVSFLTYTFGWSLRVAGRRNMPCSGPVLLIANHQSYLDLLAIGLTSRRYAFYLAKATLFENRILAGVIRSLGAVPIDLAGFSRDGLRATAQLLDEGKVVVVFPEGERTPDGALHDFKPGVTLLLKKLRAAVVPLGIAGAYHAWPRQAGLPRFAPRFLGPRRASIAVSLGKPLDGAALVRMPRDEQLRTMHEAVRAECERAERLRRKH